jgi:hypothetical protein
MKLIIAVGFVVGLATAANGAVTPVMKIGADTDIILIAGGCASGYWRDSSGRCHPMAARTPTPTSKASAAVPTTSPVARPIGGGRGH